MNHRRGAELKASPSGDRRRLRLAKAGLLKLARKPVPRSVLSPPQGDQYLGTEILRLLLEERRNGR